MGPAGPYGMVVLTPFDAPTVLLIVADTDVMDCNREVLAGTVPEKLKGTETVKLPPKPWEEALSNHTVAAEVRSTVTVGDASVNPAAAVNCTFRLVKDRVVVKPVTFSVKLLVLVEATVPAIKTGASEGTVNCSVVGLVGVSGTPPVAVVNDGVNVMVLATVPVCS